MMISFNRNILIVTIAGVALLISGSAYAGPGPSGTACDIGKISNAGDINLDVNGNRSYDGSGGGDSNFQLAAFDPAPESHIPGNFAGAGVDAVARYVTSTATYIDLNSNFSWDGTQAGDGQFFFAPGRGMQNSLVGDWGMNGNDAWGIYDTTDDVFLLDLNDDGVYSGNSGGDLFFALASSSGLGLPFSGDFTGNGVAGTGKLVNNNNFIMDINANGLWEGNPLDFNGFFAPGATGGIPIIGNWDGSADGSKEIGIYHPASDQFMLDLNGNKEWEGNVGGDALVVLAAAAGPGIPVVCDWDGDGADDVAKVVGDSSNWIMDLNGDKVWQGNAGGDFNGFFGPGSGTGQPMAGVWSAP
jgi:hypothetical protein